MPLTHADLVDFDEHSPPPRLSSLSADPPPRFTRVKATACPEALFAGWHADGRVHPRAVCVPAYPPRPECRHWRLVAVVEVGYPSNTFLVLAPPEER